MTTVTPPRHAAPAPHGFRTRPVQAPQRVPANIDPFRVLRRHMLAIIASVIIGTGVGVVAHFVFAAVYPLYNERVLFEIKPGVRDVREIGSSDIFQDQLVTRLGTTESILLTSREVVEGALRDPQVRQTRWFQRNFIDSDGTEQLNDAADELLEDLKTAVLRDTNLFSLSWSAHHASDIPTVLNAVSRAYMDKRALLDNRTYSKNVEVFNAQLSDTQGDIIDLDASIQNFIRQQGLQTLTDPRDSQVAYRMQQLNQKIIEGQGDYRMALTSYNQAAAKLEGQMEPTYEDRFRAEREPAVMHATNHLQQINTELAEARKKYHEGHKTVSDLEIRQRAAEEELKRKIDDVMTTNLNAAMKIFWDQAEQFKEMIDRHSEEYESLNLQLRDLAAHQSEYQKMETQREYLQEQRDADIQLIKEVHLMQLRADASRVQLAQNALEPRELSFPQPEVVVPLGALLVLSLTVGMIFLREFTDQRVKSATDLAVVPGAQVLGMIPDLVEDPTKIAAAEMVVRRRPNSVLAESYRQVFAAVNRQVDRFGHQTIVVMSGLPGSGSTTAVSNLAATWAAAGRRVVVADGNFRRPRLAEAMNVPGDGPGLGDILAGEASIDQTVVEADGGVSVIPVGSPANRVFELLNTRQFDSLLAELRDRYDLVIFDSPPAVVAGEALALANRVDAAVLVVRAYQEQRGLVARLVHQLTDAHCELLGILLNRPRGTAGGYFRKNFATMAAYSSARQQAS